MDDEKKIPRLGKAAGEFNVATSSIVSLLKKRNIEIIDTPNTKLSPEMYDILLKEYQSDKMVKEDAKKLEIGAFAKSKAEEEEHKHIEELKHQTEVIIPVEIIVEQKPQIPPSVDTKPTTEEKKVERTKVILPGVKVVGVKELEPKKKATTEIVKPKVKEPIIVEPVVEVAPPKEVVAPKPDHIPTVVEDISKKFKERERGWIDLSLIEESKPKKNRNKKDKKQDKKARGKENKPVVKEFKPEEKPNLPKKGYEEKKTTPAKPLVEEPKNEIEHIKTKIPKLTGPVFVTDQKVDLDRFNRKPQPNKESTGNGQAPSQTQAKDKQSTDKKRKRKRIKHHSGKQGGDKQNQAPVAKVEISDEDIQRQIRETMQRLEPIGKSKTSKRRREKRAQIHTEMMESEMQELQNQKKLKVTEFITANDLSVLMKMPVNQIISTCMSIGLFVSINQRLDAETIALLAEEFGFEVEFVGVDLEESVKLDDEDKPEDLEPRHPIITVMGHVDHGKTSLLDYIRKSNVIAGEAGGITQHIGAYLVNLPDGRKITFLDTPGHEAFTAMRARGAKVTDLCIIVIAADDSVMPQTVEAINHAQAAGVPMVFAITKIDKPNAAPEKIREGLANMNILVEDWGGKYQCQEINSKQGTNIDTLLEKILLEAELLDLKANPNKHGGGTVLESSLDKGKGYVAKVLIQNGTVKIGDPILAGNYYGKVKALFNERNQPLKEAGPATPILLLGLNGAPQAGDILKVSTSEHDARIAATKRAQLAREMGLRTQKHITLDEIGRRIAIGDFKELNIIVKGDVDGSVEALSDSLLKLSTEQVQVNVIHKSVGAVTESDVLLASASNAIIVAFQVRPSPSARKLAEQEQIDIRIYSIIYTAINEINDAIAGMHTPEIREKILCNLEVREVFKITKVGNVAGCMSLDGKLQRNTKIRLIRDGIVIYSGKLGSLKRFKDDVKEVLAGQDCGLNIENFNDVKVGDIIEGYEEYEVKVTL